MALWNVVPGLLMTDVRVHDPWLIEVSSGVVEIDVDKFIVIESHSGLVEVDTGERGIIEVTKELKYVSNKMTFVVGSSSGVAVSPGAKNTYGTRFGDGTITQWTLMTDKVTDVSVRILKATAFPVFAPILTMTMLGDTYETAAASIPLEDLDVLDFEVVSNTAASKITVELLIR